MSGLERLGAPFDVHPDYRSSLVVCRHCGGQLPVQPHQGRPRRWCSEACRLRAYRKRRDADSTGPPQ